MRATVSIQVSIVFTIVKDIFYLQETIMWYSSLFKLTNNTQTRKINLKLHYKIYTNKRKIYKAQNVENAIYIKCHKTYVVLRYVQNRK